MPLTLTDPDIINGIITDEEITSFTVDIDNQLIYVVYDRKDTNGVVIIPDVSHTISNIEMPAVIARASEIAAVNGGDVYTALKQALYEFLPGNGVIT